MTAVLRPTAPALPTSPGSSALLRDKLSLVRSWLARTGGHGAWIAAWTLVGWIGIAAAPFLIEDHPFLLMVLAPRTLFVALAVDSVDVVTFVLAGTLRLSIADGSYFIIGRRFPRQGRRVLAAGANAGTIARLRRTVMRVADTLAHWLCARGLKAGIVLFFRPNARYMAVAGSYGVSARLAGWSSVIGTAVYLTSMYVGVGALF